MTTSSNASTKSPHHDWENSHPLDLTDEGLMADLEDRKEAKDLALDTQHNHHNHNHKNHKHE